ncbi:GntR family transcriptional regulator [Streptomyces sp. CB03234]|uniref:FadR/GntR family transcriptional regulator n=1 Tax=Streptomyces sp. (strain CB03234) TaxID=1703937 RepID=UPI000938BE8C|nr:FadR/GntR family transcriptional regulator [Streptomyces sp. CB03234]OKJ96964.1 GntR family transcriptional regulator [Streptomyces sp. CB03234]
MAVTDEAIQRIKGMIVSGALRPGDRLPKESELAAELGLSRNSLREAVRALSLIRILDVRQGDGTYVTSLDPQLLLEALGFVVDFHRDDTALEFLAVRRILEPAATGMAASRISEAELDALERRLEALGDEASVEELAAADLEFHRTIVMSAGNAVLGALLDGLSGPTTRARVWRGLAQQDAVGRTLHEHRAILAALRDRDAEAARSWATAHVAGVERCLRTTTAALG